MSGFTGVKDNAFADAHTIGCVANVASGGVHEAILLAIEEIAKGVDVSALCGCSFMKEFDYVVWYSLPLQESVTRSPKDHGFVGVIGLQYDQMFHNVINACELPCIAVGHVRCVSTCVTCHDCVHFHVGKAMEIIEREV